MIRRVQYSTYYRKESHASKLELSMIRASSFFFPWSRTKQPTTRRLKEDLRRSKEASSQLFPSVSSSFATNKKLKEPDPNPKFRFNGLFLILHGSRKIYSLAFTLTLQLFCHAIFNLHHYRIIYTYHLIDYNLNLAANDYQLIGSGKKVLLVFDIADSSKLTEDEASYHLINERNQSQRRTMGANNK